MHACRPTAVKQLANFSARLAGKAAWQCWQARLPGKAARQRLPCKAAGQVHIASLNLFGLVWTAARANSVEPVQTCLDRSARKAAGQARARLPGKRAQGCRVSARKAAGQARASLYAMVQYAESMVKLVENAVF
jgi:hypothetical protein